METKIIKNKSIEEYIDFPNFDTGTFADDLIRRTQNSGIPSWVFPLFRDYLKLNYYGMLYSLIPLTVVDDEYSEKYYMHNISKIICRTFLENKNILNNIDEETKNLTGLTFEKVISGSKVHTGDDTTKNKAMVETSPITSGALDNGEPNYVIDTPSGRNIGDSIITYNNTLTDSLKEYNPYYYEEFTRVLTKYNLYNIYDRAIRSVIKEFIEVY